MLTFNHKYHPLIMLLLATSVLFYTGAPMLAGDEPLEPISKINGKIEYNKVQPEHLTDINLEINDMEKHQLREEAPEVSMDSKIKLTPEEAELKDALEFQKAKDIEDVKVLWNATVARNPVIRFALEKIATPPEMRAVKSSLMARTISTMIQGAAILPTLFGMGAASEYASAFGGQVVNNAFSKKFVPEPGMPSITEPELIQLTGFIEELQNDLIKTYFDYKNSLESLMLERKNLILQEKNYKKALASKDKTAIIISSALYDKSKQSELRLKQQVKLNRVELERLAGIEAVSQLRLTMPEKLIEAKYNFELSDVKRDKKEKTEETKKTKLEATDIPGLMEESNTQTSEDSMNEAQ
jgi:hypothetical protein